MTDDAKRKARKFCREYKVCSPSEKQAENIIESMGFTVVEYSPIANDPDVDILIKDLNLSNETSASNGFTYVSSQYRLVFINNDLSDKEKRIVLLHELGHIYCGHFSHSNIIGLDVSEEHEANEFAHYVMYPTLAEKTEHLLWSRKKMTAAAVILLIICCITAVYAYNSKTYYGEYYVTESGQKYHRAECIYIKSKNNTHRMTKEEFESGEYEPCKVCLP